MTTIENTEIIRNYATAILELLNSKPLDPPMVWMTPATPEEFAGIIARQCASMAVEIAKLVIDRPITIEPN